MQKILAVPDIHCPFEDRKSIDLMLKVAKDLSIDTVVLLGDFMDYYSVSFFSRDPQKEELLVSEIEQGNTLLEVFDKAFKDARKIYIEGNHEYRLTRYLSGNARSLYGIVSTPQLLHLRDRGWEYVTYGNHIKIGKLLFTHEGVKSGKYPAATAVARYGKSICFGHHHRLQSIERRVLNERLVGFSPGVLADIDAISEYIIGPADWHTGFATVLMQDNGDFFHQLHPIIKGKCFAWGKLYKL